MVKYSLALFCALLIVTNNICAQDYKTGIGLRGGWTGGLTAKHFIKEGKALEGILSTGWNWRGYQLTGLYEIHKAAFTKDDVEGFFWYYGAGAHIGWAYSYQQWHPTGTWTGYWETHYYTAIGVDGIFGLEYKIQELPVTISLDVKPFIEFSDYRDYPFHFWDAGFSIRYIF